MSVNDLDLQKIHSDIRAMQTTAELLLAGSKQFPALNRNVRRIQAGLKMLELNICDLVELEKRTAE